MEDLAEILVIVAMLAVNAVFASYEMALASVSRARLEVLFQAKRRGARCAVYMKDRLEGSLAVIQLGITLAGAVAAATGGAAIDESLSPWLMATFGFSVGTAEFLALVSFVVPLSAVTITFAELVPKMVGINNKEGVVLALSPAMKAVSGVFYPAVFVFEWVVKKLMRMGRGRWLGDKVGGDQTGLLDLRAAASLARATRIIGPLEERIVMSAVQLSVRTVADAMVPARDIESIPARATLVDALIEAHLHMHTRYPVCSETGNTQSISGYVTFKDIVTALKVDPSGSGLHGIVRPIRRIPARTTLAQALTDMIRDRVHIALATEGATVQGLITMEDIVEELVGDIRDEYDRLPAHLNPIGDAWLAGGGVLIGDLAKAMGGTVPAEVDSKLTLAEWVERSRELSPRSGDTIRVGGIDMQVRKVRRNRVAEAVLRPVGVSATAAPRACGNTAVVPVPKLESDFYDWYARHEAKCREAASGNHDLVFIGDSITHLFEGDANVPGRGENVWKAYYGTRNALNLGFGWDRTQNVLWRLAHGAFAGQTPRLVVLLIGTNNLTGTVNASSNTPAEIVEGIEAICRQVSDASPKSRFLIMAVLPRAAANDPLRARISELNALLLPRLGNRPGVEFMDIGSRFLSSDGSIPVDLMNDGVHPTEKGYQIWAEAIESVVCRDVGPR